MYQLTSPYGRGRYNVLVGTPPEHQLGRLQELLVLAGGYAEGLGLQDMAEDLKWMSADVRQRRLQATCEHPTWRSYTDQGQGVRICERCGHSELIASTSAS